MKRRAVDPRRSDSFCCTAVCRVEEISEMKEEAVHAQAICAVFVVCAAREDASKHHEEEEARSSHPEGI